jgi:hypothetical protein
VLTHRGGGLAALAGELLLSKTWWRSGGLHIEWIVLFNLLVAVVGNLVFCIRAKLETESVTPDTNFSFNSKDMDNADA